MTQKHISHLFKFSITILGPFGLLTFKIHTIKPVYNGYPWDPKRVAIAQNVVVINKVFLKIAFKTMNFT
jgi:hypothetical protein